MPNGRQRPTAPADRSSSVRIDWSGKELSERAACEPCTALLRELPERSLPPAGARDLLVEGDNLDALKLLLPQWRGRIDLVYIDPPYNTGKRQLYRDRFDAGGEWLSMIHPRLILARELLAEHGTLFVSIDDKELHHLRLLLDEVFGAQGFLGTIVWRTATDNNASQIAAEHEYVLAYARQISAQGRWSRPSENARAIQAAYEELRARHGADDAAVERALASWIAASRERSRPDLSGVEHYRFVDERGVFYPGNPANTRPGGYEFDIRHPMTGAICAKPSNGYRWTEATFRSALERGDVLWGADERTIPKIKKRLETARELLRSTWYEDNRRATRELSALMGAKVFANPKSVRLLQRIFRFAAGPEATILDFFAGSGTTAEAVLRLDAEDDGRRRYILVQRPEPLPPDSVAARQGLATIADIARERVRRVLAELGAQERGLRVVCVEERGSSPHA